MPEKSDARLRAFADESNKIEGMGPATDTELTALDIFLARPVVTVAELEVYVAVVAPGHVLRRNFGLNVRVGDYIAPPGGPEIEQELARLLDAPLSPYNRHRAYETLHPFTDGNGRSGRALWLYQHLRQNTGHWPLQLGFLHSFYYETLAAIPARG